MTQPGYEAPGQPWPYAPVAPPPRKSYVGLIVGIAVAATVLLAACCVGGFLVLRASGFPRTASPPDGVAPSAAEPTTRPFAGDLRTLLLPTPAGSTPLQPAEGSSDGTVSLAQAAASYDDVGTGLERLESLGYQQGAATAWRADKYYVYLSLYQFSFDVKAEAWVRDVQFSVANSPDHQPGEPLRDVPLGRFFARKAADENGYWYINVYFSKQDIAVNMFVATSGKVDVEQLTKLAQDQFQLLP